MLWAVTRITHLLSIQIRIGSVQFIDMFAPHLKAYHSLPVLDLQVLTVKTYTLFGELILDYSGFSHPGTNKVIEVFNTFNIYQPFHSRNHSMNAKLMIANMAIGRSSDQKGEGYELFKEIEAYEISKTHELIMEKIDFEQALLPQLSKLTKEEQETFITIPKFLNNQTLKFTDGKWSELFYMEYFWGSHIAFQIVLVLTIAYLYTNSQLLQTLTQVGLILIGVAIWTILQYYFHRFQLHSLMQEGTVMGGHYIHHAFPGFRYKLALSFHPAFIKEILIFLFLHYLIGFSIANALHLLLGIHVSMIIYDSLHYYFHFGPEINFPILRKLKQNHLKHHFQDPNKGFGVTNTLWDHLLGTQHTA